METTVLIVIIAVAAVYVLRRIIKTSSGAAGSGCGCFGGQDSCDTRPKAK